MPDDYRIDLDALATQVIALFVATWDAFATNDEKTALAIIEGEKPFIRELKPIDDRASAAADSSIRQDIILYRALRALQRIRTHLANITSTMVPLLHRIDFAKKQYIVEEKERLEVG